MGFGEILDLAACVFYFSSENDPLSPFNERGSSGRTDPHLFISLKLLLLHLKDNGETRKSLAETPSVMQYM